MDTVPPPPPPVAPVSSAPSDDKVVAIVSYLSLIGFVIALVMHNNKKSALGAYHLRQALGLMILWVCMLVLLVIPILGWILIPFVGLGIFILWLFGLIAAINGQMKPIPLLGTKFQEWFGTAFT